jgi:ABC-type phosphate transport system auxiliary subunit
MKDLDLTKVNNVLYAGFEWMTSGGNDEKTGAAKSRMLAAAIGLIIILAAYGLSSFVIKQIYQATQGSAYTE